MNRIGSIAAGALMAATSFAWPVVAQDASPSGPPLASPGPAEVQRTLTDAVDRSIAAAALGVAGDPAAALALVAERVEPVTYVGSLKGPRGAWLTGAANDVDTARLLAALITGDDAVPAVRYAACPGPVSPPTPASDGALPMLGLDLADAIAAEVTDPTLKAAILEARDLRVATRASAQRSAEALAVELARAPAPSGAVIPAADPTEHVWLQVEGAAGWTDVDPWTASGVPPCTAETTVDALPTSGAHRVAIRLVVEQRVGGALVERPVLEWDSPTADVAAARITFGFSAADGPGLVTWTPELRIDNVPFLGAPILVPAVPPPADLEGGGIDLDPFGVDGTEPEPSASPVPELDPVTAAWLDIDLVAPSGTTSLRSDVFDRIGIVARTDGSAATAPVVALDQMEGGAAALAARWQIGILVGDLRAIEDLVDWDLDVRTTDGMAGRIDGLLRLFPSFRRDLGGSPATGPIVLLAGLTDVTGPEKRGGLEPGEIVTQLVFDALHVPVADPRDVAEAARDGSAIVAAEGMLIAIAGFTPHPFGSADAVFAAAAKAGTALVLLSPGDALAITGASPRALARMGRALAAGRRILTPAVAPSLYGTARTAWFAIDPVTGIVRDEHDSGRHSGMTEDVSNRTAGPSGWQKFCTFAERIGRPVALTIALMVSVVPASMNKGADLFAKGAAKVAAEKDVSRRKREVARQVACGPRVR